MMIEPNKINETAQKFEEENKNFRTFLRKNANRNELDSHFRRLHNDIFAEYDCCKCANCCKTYDILIGENDITVIAAYLGQSEKDFISNYLAPNEDHASEDEEYQIKEKPCCFLGADGKCAVQECKPRVCGDFPHTDKPDRLYNLLNLLEFAEDCPVVFEIFERLKIIYNWDKK